MTTLIIHDTRPGANKADIFMDLDYAEVALDTARRYRNLGFTVTVLYDHQPLDQRTKDK